jgi:general L-amino acid transport system permease protein
LFFGVFPIAALILLGGGDFSLNQFIIGRIVPLAAMLHGVQIFGLTLSFWLDFVVSSALIVVATYFIANVLGAGGGCTARAAATLLIGIGVVLLALDFDFGLVPVETRQWGGLLVTLVVSVTGIVTSLPLGILLALGRRSHLPIVRIFSVCFIEFWRGVPLITVLFFATYMLPLFLPGGLTVDGLLRALIGVALFSAAYMAEVVRGGLQAIPKGQYEAADGLGLGYWQKMRKIILPQALAIAIPPLVNTFISFFKDTSLVIIIGLYDLLGTAKAALSDPSWRGFYREAYLFIGVIYWIFCFSMSKYSQKLERDLNRGHRR